MEGSIKTRMFLKRGLLGWIAGLVIVFALLLGTAPQAAKADDPEPTAQAANAEDSTPALLDYEGSRYGYNSLSAAEKVLYDEFYDNLVAFMLSDKYKTETLTVGEALGKVSFAESENKETLIALKSEQITHTYEVFRADQPIFYYLGGRYGAISGEEGYLFATPDANYLTAESRKRVDAYIIHYREEWLKEINKIKNDGDDTDDLTDDVYEIALLLHDLIINRIDYAYTSSGQPVADMWAHNIAGVFTGQGGVCESYAKTFKYMLDVAGIENIYLSGLGDGENHAWNAVKVGADWCLIDVTWDDLNKGPDSATTPAGHYDWFMSPKTSFNTKHAPNLNMYALPEFYDGYDYLYYDKYESRYTGEGSLSAEGAATFVAAAEKAAPGAYVYYIIPIKAGEVDSTTASNIVTATGHTGKYNMIVGLFGAIFINVDTEKVPTQSAPWLYPGDENLQQTNITVLEGTMEHIWAKGSKEYSKVTLKTSLKPSNYKDSKGKTKKGKVGFVALSSDTGIEFDTDKRTVTTKSDKSIVTVSSKGVVSAKAPGTAYVYAYDTGSLTVQKFTVDVAMAPTKLILSTAPGMTEKDCIVKKKSLDPGISETIYIVEQAGNFTVSGGTTYKAVVEGEGKNVVSASEVGFDDKGNLCFTVTAKEKPSSSTKLSKAKVTIINNESGKKVKVNVTVGNPVTDIVVTGSGNLEKKGDSVDLKISFITPYGSGLATTDGVKLAVSLSDPDIDEKKVTLEKGSDIKIKYDKKTGNLKVTAAKDINEGGGVYLLLKDKGSGEWRSYEICYVDSSGKMYM